MRDETRMLLESMGRLFEDHCTKAVADAAEAGTFPDALWQAVSESGVPQGGVVDSGVEWSDLYAVLRVAGPNPDRATATALGRLVAQLATLRRMSLSIAGMLQEGLQPLNEAAVTKDLGTRYEQDLPVIARQLFPAEPEIEAVDTYVSILARATMNAPRLSIQGGTREILRGIIARGLGLR